jgi:putative ABC transport system permease protein
LLMLRETITLAWREIRAHLMRSSLTTLGIVIGVSAVIAILTVSDGLKARITNELSGIGGNLLTLRPGQTRGDSVTSFAQPFRPEDVAALRREVQSIADVAPVATRPTTAIAGNVSLKTVITGTDSHFLIVRNRRIVEGRFFTEAETTAGRPLCVIGGTVYRKLFSGTNALEASLRIGEVSCDVIGVLDTHGDPLSDGEDDNLILAPILMVQDRLIGSREVNAVFMLAVDSHHIQAALDEIRGVMAERRHPVRGEADFQVEDVRELRQKLNKAFRIIGLTLGAIAGISLLVGGVGIMNIMLVSVTERTREIGTRLAIGAMPADVRMQFLVEATLLSVLGGVAGIGLGLGISAFACRTLAMPYLPNPLSILVILASTSVVGLIFGFTPAQRASRLPPAQAMRHE